MENNPELSAKEVKELQAKTVAAKDGQKAAFKKQRMEQFAKSKEEPKGPGRPPALKKPDDSKILPKTKGTKRIHSDKKDEELDSEEELSEDESALSDKEFRNWSHRSHACEENQESWTYKENHQETCAW